MSLQGNPQFTPSKSLTRARSPWKHDISKREPMSCFKVVEDAHNNWVTALALQDGIIYTGSWDGTIKAWDAETLEHCGTMEAHVKQGSIGRIRALTVTDKYLWSASDDETIKVWGLKNLCCVATLTGHSGWVMCLVSNQDRLIASGSADETVQLWESNSFVNVEVLKGHTAAVNTVVFMEADWLFSGGSDGVIRLWDLKQMRCTNSVNAHDNWVAIIT